MIYLIFFSFFLETGGYRAPIGQSSRKKKRSDEDEGGASGSAKKPKPK